MIKAVIVLGGDEPGTEFLREQLSQADVIVAADGGAQALVHIGVLPHVLLGDMDSLDEGLARKLEQAGVPVLRCAPEKDFTDGQLAVDWALDKGATDIALLGALGGRLDHLLGNVALLLRTARRGAHCEMRDERTRAWAATGLTDIQGDVGDTVSLLPLAGDASARYLSGLQYGTQEPLALPADMPIGVSNVLIAQRAKVDIKGWALVVVVKG